MIKILTLSLSLIMCAIAQKTNYITQLQNKPFGDPREYNWTKTVGSGVSGSLSSIGNNTLTFNNCPYGVMGNATNMWVQISGGTGTTEGAKIIGGSCLGTGLAGTLIITTVNTHSGSWKIGSANSGVREAMNINLSKVVKLLPGTYSWYAPLYMQSGSVFECAQAGSDANYPACTVLIIPNNISAVVAHTADWLLKGIRFARDVVANGAAVVGSNGIETLRDNITANAYGFKIEDVAVAGFYNNLVIVGSSMGILQNVLSNNGENDCFVARSAQGYWTNVTAVACKGDGFALENYPGGGVNPMFTNLHSYANGQWGVRIAHTSTWIDGCYLNNESQGNLIIMSTANAADNHMISNCILEYAGDNPFDTVMPDVFTAPAIKIEAGAGPVTFTNISIFTPNGNGLDISNSYNIFDNVRVIGAGLKGQAGHTSAVILNANSSANRFTNYFGAPVKIVSGQFNSFTQGLLEWNSNTVPAFEIAGGIHHMLDRVQIFNAGTAAALKIAPGVSMVDGTNTIYGGIDNQSSRSDQNTYMLPLTIPPVNFDNLSSNAVLGQINMCVGCTLGSSPCTAGGSVVLAIRIPPNWVCNGQGAVFAGDAFPPQIMPTGMNPEPRKLPPPPKEPKLQRQLK